MPKKMLIDATHAEETRVVVVDGNKVEEFDFESENKRQLAGNIYLAKVTRVEPSLQAAFVDYGGNRHGFLAFSEIHPDYYQIPVADREALLEEERAYAEAMKSREDEDGKPKRGRRRGRSKAARTEDDDAVVSTSDISGMETIDLDDEDEGLSPRERAADVPVEAPDDLEGEETDADSTETTDAGETGQDDTVDPSDDETGTPSDAKIAVSAQDDAEDSAEEESPKEENAGDLTGDIAGDPAHDNAEEADAHPPHQSDAIDRDASIESVADEDDSDDIRPPRKPRPRRYKIQEVVKVRQILLVQVVKEERGNKGAALTTYLSLAGRYCVLMPNTARGGGISRKITNAADRKKLKEIAGEIDVPQGAGLIVRTAGAKRTKTEIKRDYEYLQRMWEQIRELTLKSIAPAKIYEEGDLIKRSIRDLYNREIDEVLVEGERGYRIAKDFMKMIMPSHAKNVQHYADALPLFARFQVESYLTSMFNPSVQLKSGGYIVIGVTEALVAIDVNSGKATKEGSIEETALKTNLEAADEVARQLRLRDLAGLIVIDFIDMDERKNNSAVEKRMKERLKTDRARIQIGRISGFGLMEMSRQRLRPGMLEATTQPCPHCHGTGLIRSDDNLALSILRQIEEEGVRRRSREVLVKCPIGIVNYLMNQKREHVAQIEARYGLSVRIEGDPKLISPDFSIEKFKTATRVVPQVEAPHVSVDSSLMEEIDAEEEERSDATDGADVSGIEDEDKPKKKRRRRRRRSRGRGNGQSADQSNAEQSGVDQSSDETEPAEEAAIAEALVDTSVSTAEPETEAEAEAVADDKPKPRRRSRSRRKSDKDAPDAIVEGDADTKTAAEESQTAPKETAEEVEEVADAPPAKPKRKTRARKPKSEESEASAEPEAPSEPAEAAPAKPKARSRKKAAPAEAKAADPDSAVEVATEVSEPVIEPVIEPAFEPAVAEAADTVAEPTAEPETKPKRRGWWSIGE
ncbi:MAG: Rne/Rng family ribonuclease [Pseudomonadota bacterium]